VDYGGFGNSGKLTYSGILVPRFLALLGNIGDIYISAGFEVSYNEGWLFVPELLRTELSLYSGLLDFTAGRMHFSDPLGFIAEGLFDGMLLSLEGEAGTFSLGAWYTGFLYKRRANIAMTPNELRAYSLALDFNDFQNTYFAPRRFVSALGWEHLGGPVKARVSLLGQFDLSNGFDFFGEEGRASAADPGNALLHSQYLTGKISLPGNIFGLDLGGSLALIQNGGDSAFALAAELGLAFMPPTRFPNRLSFLARYASGISEDGAFTAFRPLTTKTQGEILNATLSGLSLFSLNYTARPNRALSLGITSTYFIRNDFETYIAYPASSESNAGYFLGNEFFGKLSWAAASDLQFNLGGGVFLPSLGNIAPDAESSWRMELNIIISLR
jgi:hypothetical protein